MINSVITKELIQTPDNFISYQTLRRRELMARTFAFDTTSHSYTLGAPESRDTHIVSSDMNKWKSESAIVFTIQGNPRLANKDLAISLG